MHNVVCFPGGIFQFDIYPLWELWFLIRLLAYCCCCCLHDNPSVSYWIRNGNMIGSCKIQMFVFVGFFPMTCSEEIRLCCVCSSVKSINFLLWHWMWLIYWLHARWILFEFLIEIRWQLFDEERCETFLIGFSWHSRLGVTMDSFFA